MARLKSPLMSLTAQKQLGHELIYKMKNNRAFVTGYSRPGRKNPFAPSTSQRENREFYALAIAAWQEKTQEQKDYWNDLAKARALTMSGWNLFYKTEFANPTILLTVSYYGERLYGNFAYGKTT